MSLESYSSLILDTVRSHGYTVVFLGLVLENTLGLGLIVPGLLVLIAAGYYSGVGSLSVYYSILFAAAGTFVGDNISYAAGRWGLTKTRYFARHGAKWNELRQTLTTRGRWFVFLFHFPVYSRLFMPLLLGTLKFNFRAWLLIDALGATLFSTVFVLIGFSVGRTARTIDVALETGKNVQWVFLAVLIVWILSIARSARRYIRNKRIEGSTRQQKRMWSRITIDACRRLLRRVSIRGGRSVIQGLNKVIEWSSSEPCEAVLDSGAFDWIPAVEKNWQSIQNEAKAILRSMANVPAFQRISRDQEKLTQDEGWKAYFLYGYGYKMGRNCADCPTTTRIVESIPGMSTAFFSILSPGKHIPEHRGLYKGVLRYQLGVIIPEPRELCKIRIANEIVCWEEGKSLIFDDTFPHEVWNDTGGVRVVLFVNVDRPMPSSMTTLHRIVMSLIRRSPYVQEAKRNLEDWEKRRGIADIAF